jgi:hypothetical protein
MKTRTLFFAMLALVSFHEVSGAPTSVLTDPDGIAGFEFYNNGLIWWDTALCNEAAQLPATIRLRPSDPFGWQKNLARDCAILASGGANAVADGSYAYFFRAGQLHKKALNAAESAGSTAIATPPFSPTLPAGQSATFVEMADDDFVFARYQNATEVLTLHRLRMDGTANVQTLTQINGAGANVKKLQSFEYRDSDTGDTISAVAILLENGKLYRYRPRSLGATLLAVGVADFAIHTRWLLTTPTTSIYAAIGQSLVQPNAPPGQLVRILADSGAKTVLYTAQGINQVIAVGTDGTALSGFGSSRNIYFTEAVITCGSLFCTVTDRVIRRNSVPGTSGTWDLIVNTGGGENLRSDNQYLYWIRNNSIVREKTDAPPIVFDLQAEGLEIVQYMQTLTADEPLIANKQGTMARGYARTTVNTTGNGVVFPSAELRVFIDGNEVTGSPFSPVNNANITNVSVTFARSNVINSFLFSLGPLPPGVLTATFTVNPNHTLYETGNNPYANNTKALDKPLDVLRSSVPCLMLVPVPTVLGRFWPSDPSVPLILQRAASMLPVQDFDVRDWAELADDHGINDDVYFFLPFGGVNSDDEQDDDALDAIECVRDSSSYPSGCDAAHWIGMIHPGLVTNYVGFGGGLGNRPGSCLIASMRSDGSGMASSLGGVVLAHELGHNYGRRHVPCACSSGTSIMPPFPNGVTVPQSFTLTYPFPFCSIIPAPQTDTDFGFDWISRTPINPISTSDLMSYGCRIWPSRWTWSRTYGAMIVTSGIDPFLISPAQALTIPSQVLFVTGVVQTNKGTAMLKWFYQLPASQVDRHNLSNALYESQVELDNPERFNFRLLAATGAVLSETPLPLNPVTDGDLDRFYFSHYIPFTDQTRRVQLMRGNVVYAERMVSSHPPMITLGPLSINPAEQTAHLSWMASDPDGDPIYFFIHYSPDNGATWDVLSHDYHSTSFTLSTRRWPASAQGRLRILVTDGVRTSFATTPPFVIANHAPQISWAGVEEAERIPFGESRELLGMPLDTEDRRRGVTSTWSVMGPSPRTGMGETIPLLDLAPGAYLATAVATDRNGQQTAARRRFEVLPVAIPDGPPPVLDGICADRAYGQGAFVRLLLNGGQVVPVRMSHSGSNLFVCFTELRYGVFVRSSVGLRFDVNYNRTAAPESSDLGFFVDEFGIPFQESGTSTGMVVTLAPKVGVSAVVHRGSNAWSAEFRIADHLLGGWNHLVGMMLQHGSATWPSAADGDSPASFAVGALGLTSTGSANRLPLANAGEDQVVNVATARLVILDGARSRDPDGDPIRFRWTQVRGPSVVLSNPDTMQPRFVVPPTNTSLAFQLTVSDGAGDSRPDEVQVLVSAVHHVEGKIGPGEITSDGFFGRLLATPGERRVIEASTDFLRWIPIHTNTVDYYGMLSFIDLDQPRFPYRFYRSVKTAGQ